MPELARGVPEEAWGAAEGPSTTEETKQTSDEAANLYEFEFSGTESLRIFLAVDRMTVDELSKARLVKGQGAWKFNVELKEKGFATVTKGEGEMRVCSVFVPRMTTPRGGGSPCRSPRGSRSRKSRRSPRGSSIIRTERRSAHERRRRQIRLPRPASPARAARALQLESDTSAVAEGRLPPTAAECHSSGGTAVEHGGGGCR
eukprot:3507478-Pyramimonas_sp.AAC.1